MSRKSNMHVDGGSDGCVVPTKYPNNGGQPPAEGMERRRPTEENTEHTTVPRTQRRISVSSGLPGVREVARKERARFNALLHHVDAVLLRESFYALKRAAAPGWME